MTGFARRWIAGSTSDEWLEDDPDPHHLLFRPGGLATEALARARDHLAALTDRQHRALRRLESRFGELVVFTETRRALDDRLSIVGQGFESLERALGWFEDHLGYDVSEDRLLLDVDPTCPVESFALETARSGLGDEGLDALARLDFRGVRRALYGGLARHPGRFDLLVAHGHFFKHRDEVEPMVDYFQEALERAERDEGSFERIVALEALARAHFAAGDARSARERAAEALDRRRDARAALAACEYRYALYCCLGGRPEEAAARLLQVGEAAPDLLGIALLDPDFADGLVRLVPALEARVKERVVGARDAVERTRARHSEHLARKGEPPGDTGPALAAGLDEAERLASRGYGPAVRAEPLVAGVERLLDAVDELASARMEWERRRRNTQLRHQDAERYRRQVDDATHGARVVRENRIGKPAGLAGAVLGAVAVALAITELDRVPAEAGAFAWALLWTGIGGTLFLKLARPRIMDDRSSTSILSWALASGVGLGVVATIAFRLLPPPLAYRFGIVAAIAAGAGGGFLAVRALGVELARRTHPETGEAPRLTSLQDDALAAAARVHEARKAHDHQSDRIQEMTAAFRDLLPEERPGGS